jgi:uncharacterized membrane protein
MMFSGSLPLPPPSVLAEYNAAYPGLVDKIVEWTEIQRQHRQALERQTAEGSERPMNRGQLIAATVAIWGLTLAAAVGIFGNPYVATVIAIVAIGGPTAALLLARNTGVAHAKTEASRDPDSQRPVGSGQRTSGG